MTSSLALENLNGLHGEEERLRALDRTSLHLKKSIFLGDAPNGPRAVLVWRDYAVAGYPGRNGWILLPLDV